MNNKEFRIFLNVIFILCYSYLADTMNSIGCFPIISELFAEYPSGMIAFLPIVIFVLLDKIYVKILLYTICLYWFIAVHIHAFFIPITADPTIFDFMLWHSGVQAFALLTYLIIYSIYLERKNYLKKKEDERRKDRSLWSIAKKLSYALIPSIIFHFLGSILPLEMGNVLY